jgi:hypothetical protein
VGDLFSYLKAREDSGLQVRDVEGWNDNVCQRPVQPQVAKVSTKKRMEVLAVVLRPNHHSQSAGDLGEDPVPASFSEHWHFERQETKVTIYQYSVVMLLTSVGIFWANDQCRTGQDCWR